MGTARELVAGSGSCLVVHARQQPMFVMPIALLLEFSLYCPGSPFTYPACSCSVSNFSVCSGFSEPMIDVDVLFGDVVN